LLYKLSSELDIDDGGYIRFHDSTFPFTENRTEYVDNIYEELRGLLPEEI